MTRIWTPTRAGKPPVKDLPALNRAVDRLMTLLAGKQDELRRDVRKMTRLRAEIASLEKRLSMAERLQDAALACPDA